MRGSYPDLAKSLRIEELELGARGPNWVRARGQGDQAGRQVGNSGNTSEPHLHIQVQNIESFDDADAGIRTYPILFRKAILVRGGKADAPADVDAQRND